MNFFKLYIGDYQRDTAHLSVTEHGAYMLMLQLFYATEKPLPTGKVLHRMLRADGPADRAAIDEVARQFWVETDAGLVNDRAAIEIGKSDHQRAVNREMGKRGGRPRKTEQETDSVSGIKTEQETDSVLFREPINNPIQTPDTRHQTESERATRAQTARQGSRRAPEDFAPDLDFARAKLPDLDAQAEAEKFRDFEFARPRKDWPATWRNWIRTCADTGRYARRKTATNGRHRTDAQGFVLDEHGNRTGEQTGTPFAHLDMR